MVMERLLNSTGIKLAFLLKNLSKDGNNKAWRFVDYSKKEICLSIITFLALLFITFAFVMKKFVVILVLFSYTVSVTGLTVSSFYCCGKLKSTKIVFASTNKKSCTAKMSNKKCCRYDESFVKVNDNHFGSTAEFVPDVHVAEVVYFDALSLLQNRLSSLNTHYSNAPPLNCSQPQYLMNCNFRI